MLGQRAEGMVSGCAGSVREQSGRLSPPRCRFTVAARTPGATTRPSATVVDFIKRERITGVVMISADYHFARDWSSKRTGIHEFMAGRSPPSAPLTNSQKRANAIAKGRISCSAMIQLRHAALRRRQRKLTVSYQDSGGKNAVRNGSRLT